MDRSMDEKLYSLIEANVQITNETISQLEGENDQVFTVIRVSSLKIISLEKTWTRQKRKMRRLMSY